MAEEAKPGPKFDFHGFIGGSLFSQDAVFNGYGQQVFFVNKQPNQDKLQFGGDARQTRLNFSLAGPAVFGGAIPKGVAEIDFFSALSNTPLTPAVGTAAVTTGPVATTPRLRLAYAELNWGATILRIGQENDLVQGTFSPTSVGHIPQSFGYGAGYIGTRHTDLELIQTMPAGDLKVELAVQVQSQLGGTADPYQATGMTTAEASGVPGLEGRLRFYVPKTADFYVAGHWQQFDRNGVNNTLNANPRGDKQFENMGTVGLKLTPGPITLQGQGYIGKNLGNGAMTGGVGNTVANDKGDFHEWGAWGQLGLNLTPEFSAWGFVGTERAYNFNDAIATLGKDVRLANTTFGGMLRYMEGGYAVGLEYLHMRTRYGSPQANAPVVVNGVLTPQSSMDGNQLMLSGMYFF